MVLTNSCAVLSIASLFTFTFSSAKFPFGVVLRKVTVDVVFGLVLVRAILSVNSLTCFFKDSLSCSKSSTFFLNTAAS